MTVRDLEHRMTSAEYRDWQRFYLQEPWGCAVEDHRVAVLASVIGGVQTGQTWTTEQLFPRTPDVYEETTAEDDRVLSEQLKVLFMKIDKREEIKAQRDVA